MMVRALIRRRQLNAELAILTAFPAHWPGVWCASARLQRRSGVSPARFRSAVDRLTAAGLVETRRTDTNQTLHRLSPKGPK